MSKLVADLARFCDSILAHARHCYPDECVGLIVDTPEGAIALQNVHPEPRRHFRMDEAEVAPLLGLPILGMYHSHPDGALQPSALDRASPPARAWLYLIVEPVTGAMRAWRWTGEDFSEVALKATDDD